MSNSAPSNTRDDGIDLGSILEHISDAVILADSHGKVCLFNRAAETMFGYSQEEMQGKQVSILVPERLREAHARGVQRIASGGTSHLNGKTVKLTGLRSDGTEFPIELSLSDCQGDSGCYLTAVIRDGSERERAEAALRLERAYFEELFQSSPEAIVLVDNESRVLRQNREFTRLFGYSAEEMTGNSVDVALASEELQSEAGAFTHRVAEGERLCVEAVRKSKEGKLIDVSILAAPIATEMGQVAAYAIYRDITDEKRADKELRTSEARYRHIFHSTSVSIWEEDLTAVKRVLDELRDQGVSDLSSYLGDRPEFTREVAQKIRVLDVNDATVNMFEAESRDELLGALDLSFIKDHLKAFEREFVAIAEGKPFFEVEVETQTLRGRPIDIVMKMMIPGETEQFRSVLVSVVDVSERKRVEEAIQRTQRLESLGMLGGGLAHEFNNILVSILGNAELAQMELPTSSPVRDMLTEIGSAVHRAAELTDEMLAFSGKAKVDIKPLDVTAEVQSAKQSLEAICPANLMIQYDLPVDLPQVLGDPSRIKQALLGLVSNAAEAMEGEQGTISVSAGLSNLDSSELRRGYWTDALASGQYVSLRVTDTGVGMGRDTMAKVFDPFFSTKFAGRGLGLAAVLGIMRSIGGAIQMVSGQNQGTTVTLVFPRAESAQKQPASTGKDFSEWRGSGEILVVDDERAVRSVTKKVLCRWGFTVLTADDGDEGVELFRNNSSNLKAVLLDFMMPKMNGDLAFAEMRGIDPHVPIILLSGYADRDTGGESPFEGPDAFIHKPFELTELFETLLGVLKLQE